MNTNYIENYIENYTENDYRLYHHGIQGQKWGNRNGPPYPLDASDHSAAEKKAGWRKSLDTTKTKTTLKVAAGITIAALVAYGGYKYYGTNYVDKVITKGTTLHTLTMDPNRLENGRAFYTAFVKGDIKKYRGLFSEEKNIFEGKTGKYKLDISADVVDTMKIASPKSGEKVFLDLAKKDKRFLNFAANYGNYTGVNDACDYRMGKIALKNIQEALKNNKPIDDKDLKKFYTLYNASLGGNAMHPDTKKFYDALKKAGYSGIVDVNDLKYSGFDTKVPTVVFDFSKYANITATRLTKEDVKTDRLVEFGKVYTKALIKGSSPYVFIGGAAVLPRAIENNNKKKSNKE